MLHIPLPPSFGVLLVGCSSFIGAHLLVRLLLRLLFSMAPEAD